MNSISHHQSVWAIKPGETRTPGLVHAVALAVMSGLGIVVSTFGSIAFSIGFVSVFWPGQAVQSVGAIWFGGWGGIAAALFPFISNSLSGAAPLVVSLAFVPANIVQAMFAAWSFRYLDVDPRLQNWRDLTVWAVGGVLVPNLLGAAWGTAMLYLFGLITTPALAATFVGWFVGNSVPSLILGTIVLKSLSPLVIRSRAFVKGYWA